MTIDWFTFVAQVINFLVLVTLLRWLLYDRVVGAMQQRERDLADRWAEADRLRAEAAAKISDCEAERQVIVQQREALLQEARSQAEQERRAFLQTAREEVDHQREQWRRELDREQEGLQADLRRRAAQTGWEVARHLLIQLADADLERRACQVFARRWRQLGEPQRQEFLQQVEQDDAVITVRSAFPMADELQEQIRGWIREFLEGHDLPITFETSDDVMCGMELEVAGYRWGWNVQEFLQDMADDWRTQLEA